MFEVHGSVSPGFESVREVFEQHFQQHAEVGAAVCVYRHGRPVVDVWAGTADADTGRPWREDTLAVIYSATKSATAACAHLLAQRGELDLEAPVAHYWPEFAAAGKGRIPVRWLLSHQAGLPALDKTVTLQDVTSWDPVVSALAAQAPAWVPGSAHGYHGLTFGWLVGEVVRRVSGRSLGNFFAQEIAAPLGLDFWIGLPEAELPRVSRIVEPPAAAQQADVDLDAVPEELRELTAAYTDPTSLTMRALLPTGEPMDLNRADLRTAEIPAVNGICTARALARFYAALIGDVDGHRILDESTLATAVTEQASGLDRILHLPTRPALGFGLPPEGLPWRTPTSFGHAGHGGFLGYADPASGIAFGYVLNRLHTGSDPDHRVAGLVRAVRSAA
ncbi:serine hydrolase domain-containing protein [Micromonospora sp. NPDC048170]|uniref:serine hydrolase domain-containing protein n=1 Tax=Micromonospora sp. NPDC048170 TaxID=3154819 RepID=UPI00340FD276